MKLYDYGLVIKVTFLKEKQISYYFNINEVFKLNLTDIFIIDFLSNSKKVLTLSFYVTKFGVRVYDDYETLIESYTTLPLNTKDKLKTILKNLYKEMYDGNRLVSLVVVDKHYYFKLSDFSHENLDKIKKEFKL